MTLEEDPAFRKKLEEANVTDIKVFKHILYIVKGANRKKYTCMPLMLIGLLTVIMICIGRIER